MNTSAKETVIAFLTAVQQGNNATLAALLHPEVQWLQAGNNKTSGLKQNAGEVFAMVGHMFAATENTLRLAAIGQACVCGNQVAVTLHWQSSAPAATPLDVANIDMYTVEAGKITAVTVFSADTEQEDRVWGV
ncbi:nuclear transport factor 2 family protein [Taibaiella chishuiensis]|uniref:SnoaL-like domain-containing protein n=1 Tax=Taibaiella chishuiensis TaxID=1434707 RepID=A0A2P8D5M4_9BACT|nr:nuclear transport factor 2 family protein [Taibaiella chishuiensis]PSK92511.1 hypothetical protein B0I18_10388 [Taibaiella chishuiensis]